MPKFSGFELCRTFCSMTATQLIPVFVVSGEAGTTTKALCKDLGAIAYFEKPIDFDSLRSSIAKVLQSKRPERRGEVRVRLRVTIKLRGLDANKKPFEEKTATENLGSSSFLSGCFAKLETGALVEIFLLGGGEQYVGKDRVIRSEANETPYPRYAFHFTERAGQWVLQ